MDARYQLWRLLLLTCSTDLTSTFNSCSNKESRERNHQKALFILTRLSSVAPNWPSRRRLICKGRLSTSYLLRHWNNHKLSLVGERYPLLTNFLMEFPYAMGNNGPLRKAELLSCLISFSLLCHTILSEWNNVTLSHDFKRESLRKIQITCPFKSFLSVHVLNTYIYYLYQHCKYVLHVLKSAWITFFETINPFYSRLMTSSFL